MQDTNFEVKAFACRTTCLILAAISEKDEHQRVFNVILNVMKGIPDRNTVFVLSAIAELIDNSPRVIIGSVDLLVTLLVSLINSKNTSKETRSASVEVLTTAIKRSSGIVAKSSYFIRETITVSMVLLSEIEFPLNLQLWNETLDTDVAGCDPFSLGKELLCTISDIFQNPVYDHIIVLIQAHLQASHWLHQHTGIIALGLVSEGCKDSMMNFLPQFTTTLTNFIYQDNQRIKWAGLTSLALFCTYFGPNVQIANHSIVIPAILSGISAGNYEKVQIQGFKSMINFCNGITTENDLQILRIYANEIITAYSNVFTNLNTSSQVLSQLLASLSVVSLAIPNFSDYYSVFLSKLRVILYSNNFCDYELKNSAIKCIGCIIQATFAAETEAVFYEMIKLKETMTESDPCYGNITEVIVKCMGILKEKVLSYCEIIIPELLNTANCTIDFIVLDSDNPSASLLSGISIPLRGLGDKKVAISTTSLENKINACRLINMLIKTIGALYSPYVMNTLAIMCPLINFKMNPDVRKFALKIITALPSISSPSQQDLLIINIFPLLTSILSEKVSTFPEDVNKILKAMVLISNDITNLCCIGLSGAMKLSEILANCVSEVYTRKNIKENVKTGMKDPSLYCEELEVMQESEQIDEEILRNTVDMIGLLLKSFKKQFQPCFSAHFQRLFGEIFLKPNKTDSELISAICLFCDYIEHTGDLLESNNTSVLLEEFIKQCYSSNCDTRQCAVFGIGLAAVYGNSFVFSAYLNHCIDACKHILSLDSAMNDELIVCTECAAGTLGKIGLKYKEDLIPV